MTANTSSTFRGIMSRTVEELARESVGMAIDTYQRGRRKPVFFTSSNELQNYRLGSAMPELKPLKHSRFEVRHNLGLSEDASPRSDVLIPRVARNPGPNTLRVQVCSPSTNVVPRSTLSFLGLRRYRGSLEVRFPLLFIQLPRYIYL
jgi:hypothetical protein